MERIVVNDTNVFIDLHDAGLLDKFFHLSWEIHTTDFVMHELQKEGQNMAVSAYIDNGSLHVADFQFEEIIEINNLYKQFETKTNVSLTDCSVWYYAKQNSYTLLTGDRKLRNSALRDGVEVRGILFVFDSLVADSIISKQEACEKLAILKEHNPRLPQEEIANRLKLWSSDTNKEGGSL